MVRLDDPRKFKELWQRIVRASPLVDTVMVLNEDQEMVHFVTRQASANLSRFRKTFIRQILPDMKLDQLPVNAHRHLHKSYNQESYLVSYIKRRTAGGDYFIALNMNLQYITRDIFEEEFQGSW